MLPVGATWAIAGVAWAVAMLKDPGDVVLVWALIIPVSSLCFFVAYMSFTGAWQLYRGTSLKVLVPAYFTFAMFAVAVINLLVQRKISFSATQILPLAIGVLAMIANRLVHGADSRQWVQYRSAQRLQDPSRSN